MRPARLLTLLLALAAVPARGDDFKVVVHPDNPAVELERGQLSALFLKRTQRWPDGTPAEPVEPVDEKLRGPFAEQVLGRRLNALKAWWNQQIFSGRDVPPIEKGTEAEVLAFVRTHRGAVGYVSPGADTAGTKVVPVTR